MVTRVTHSNTCLCLRKCFHSFRTNSFFPILHKVVQIRSLNFLPYIANSVSNLVSLHIFSRILFFLAWEKDKTRTIHYSRNDARKIKDGWIIEKACYRCGRPLTIFYTMFPVAEAARDSDTLRFTAAATCPNLIYPGSWPVVAITTGGNPLDRNSLASSTRVNNTPGANANIVDITKVCVGSAPPLPRIIAAFRGSIEISHPKSLSPSLPFDRSASVSRIHIILAIFLWWSEFLPVLPNWKEEVVRSIHACIDRCL